MGRSKTFNPLLMYCRVVDQGTYVPRYPCSILPKRAADCLDVVVKAWGRRVFQPAALVSWPDQSFILDGNGKVHSLPVTASQSLMLSCMSHYSPFSGRAF
jgi:hypothetical protein